jgi:pSer/pThr/pTyr-binding forkhead associated (FHA) protein
VVVVTPTEVILTDQNSVNGTTVNGTAITQPQKLNDGDRVAFAKVEYRVQFIKGSGVR